MSPKRTQGRLFAIGGGEEHSADSLVLQRLVEIAGGAEARLVLCGAASNDAEETLKEYTSAFRALGAHDVHTTAFEDRSAGEDQELLERLRAATAVFFIGGDQLAITSIVAGTPFGELVRERFEGEGLVVAGTSAGAAAMAGTMLIGGRDGGTVRMADVDLAPGLGYWRDAVFDTHFNERGRMHRLLAVFAQNPQILGVGLDEDTAVEVRLGKSLRALGSGAVTIFNGRTHYSSAATAQPEDVLALSGVTIHVLAHGYGFDLVDSEILLPENDKR